MKFKKIRERSKMNATAFAKYFNIPYRTIMHWEAETRTCPPYLLELMEYKLIKEGIIDNEKDN